MQALGQHNSSLAGRLAEDLLKAWIAGNRVEVGMILKSSTAIPVEDCDSGEEERRHLLRAVAGRLRDSREFPDSNNASPELELCMSLLGHLTSGWPGGESSVN